MVLMLSGSFGFTLIRHTCLHCGTDDTVAALTLKAGAGNMCCHTATGVHNCHLEADAGHYHSTGEMIFSDDCCTHETERIVTDELVRTEVQNEIIPYFIAASLVAVIGEHPARDLNSFTADNPLNRGRDLTTILCRLQS